MAVLSPNSDKFWMFYHTLRRDVLQEIDLARPPLSPIHVTCPKTHPQAEVFYHSGSYHLIKGESTMNASLFRTVCYAIAVAMGIAVIVTNIVAPLSVAGVSNLLAIAVAALGIAALQK